MELFMFLRQEKIDSYSQKLIKQKYILFLQNIAKLMRNRTYY